MFTDPIHKILTIIGYDVVNGNNDDKGFYQIYNGNKNKIRTFLSKYDDIMLKNIEFYCMPDIIVGSGPSAHFKNHSVAIHKNISSTENVLTSDTHLNINQHLLSYEFVNHIYVSPIKYVGINYINADDEIRALNIFDACLFSDKTDPIVFFLGFLVNSYIFPKVPFKIINRSMCINQSVVKYDSVISCINRNVVCSNKFEYKIINVANVEKSSIILGPNGIFRGIVYTNQPFIPFRNEIELMNILDNPEYRLVVVSSETTIPTSVRIYYEKRSKSFDFVICNNTNTTFCMILPQKKLLTKVPDKEGYELVTETI